MKLFREASRYYLVCLFAFAILLTLTGCSDMEETIEKPMTVGSLKHTEETVPAAPQAPAIGKPFVKEIAYYKDWKLTKPISTAIRPGATIFTKVVFSEPMRFKPADDPSARPILYYRLNGKLIRFRIAKHGVGGKNFVSGDAKPLGGGTDDYICKYVVPADATGEFGAAVGKFSADREGNTLAKFYTHKEKLQIGEPITPPKDEEPIESKQPEDTMLPTVLSVTHYLDKRRSQEVDTGDSVPDGTDVYTVVRFSEPVTPVITYTTGNSIDKRYILSQQRYGIHWRGVCKPIDAKNTSFMCYTTAREDAFSVTVTAETTDLADNRLAEAITSPTLGVSPAVVPDPTPPDTIAPTPPQTAPQQEVLGADLIGRYTITNMPSEVQSLFSILNIHTDIELVVLSERDSGGRSGGLYKYPVATVYSADHNLRRNVLRIIAHELFHAHQHTIAGSTRAWEQTPEGRAYIESEKKDFAEVGKIFSYDKTGPSYESAAELFARYWCLHYIVESKPYEYIQVDMPNRYRWAEEWFGK